MTDIETLNLDMDTVIPIGLLLNELINNSLKHAFKIKQCGEAGLELKQKDSEMVLKVHDNGDGFPEDWDNRTKQSFGYKLVKAFAQKLKAKLNIQQRGLLCYAHHNVQNSLIPLN